MKPRQLYKWTVVKIPSVTFEQCTFEDHRKEMMMVEEKFRKYPKILYIIPASRNQVQTKVFSETNVLNTTQCTCKVKSIKWKKTLEDLQLANMIECGDFCVC